MRTERPFPLTGFFIATSLVTTFAIVAVTVFLSGQRVRKDLYDEAAAHGVRVVRHLQEEIREEFLVPRLAVGQAVDLNDPAQLTEIDAIVRRICTSFSIEKVYIFDATGHIQYATVHEHIGFQVPADNHQFHDALAGQVASVVLQRGAPFDIENRETAKALLETYVPVRSLAGLDPGHGPITNVIETYHDIEQLDADIRAAQRRIATYTLAGSSILFLVLLGIVVHADRIIRRQTSDLLASNRRLRELSQHLESEVERRTQQLLHKENLASIGVLASGLAHEVNNPLATVASCAQGLRRRLPQGSSGPVETTEFRRYLDLIESEVFRVKRITDSLLDFSRQQPTDRLEATDIDALLADTLALWRVGHEDTQLRIEVEAGPAPVIHPVDPLALRQVILNVTTNAADAIGAASPDLGAGGRIRWRLARDPDGLVLTCEDDGCGFSAPAEALVKPFFTTKPPGRGTGLGLALCETILQRHGGRIHLRSSGLGRGATVTITLPDSEGGTTPATASEGTSA